MLGKVIKQLRKKNKITQEILAKNIGVSTSMVGMYETNARKPSYEVLLKIANYFNVTTDYLLGKANKSNEITNKTQANNHNYLLNQIENLSDESKKELEKYIQLLKIKDEIDKGKDETLSALEKNA